MSELNVSGATAFVTGGAQGIGFGIAQSLAKRGAHVAIADIDAAALEAAADKLASITEISTHVLDVRDRQGFQEVADAVESSLGPVSLLFNNAGVAVAGRAAHMTYEAWDWALGVNLGGVVNGLQTFLPRMIERGEGGYVVNTASGAGLASFNGYLYATAKYAVVGLTESLREELSRSGIGISVLCPGPVATDISRNTVKHTPAGVPNGLREHSVEAIQERLSHGVRPEAVGEMVLKGMSKGHLHIHTDTVMAEPVKIRTQMILSTMPGDAANIS